MSMQLQYSHTIQVYIVISWLEKIQLNVWKNANKSCFQMSHNGESGCARLGPFASWFGLMVKEVRGEKNNIYIYISH